MTGEFLKFVARRFESTVFRRSFALIVIAEFITIGAAWLMLDTNIATWLHGRSTRLVQMAQVLAKADDWSSIDKIPKNRDSRLFKQYQAELTPWWHRFFPRNEGDVFLTVVEDGKDYTITPDDPHPMDYNGTVTDWEKNAYATGKTTYNDAPYSDSTGTFLAAQTPIFRDGKVVGLAGVEYDSATLPDLQELVRRAFWMSVLPGIGLAMVVAFALAGMLVEPMQLFREIEQSARLQTGEAILEPGAVQQVPAQGLMQDPLEFLSAREREVAELVRRGMRNREIAAQLSIAPETVKQHLKNIREKTGLTKVNLAVQAEARRVVASQAVT